MTQQPRKILRCVHQRADDLAHGIAAIDPYLVSRRQRKKVEMLFADLKRILGMDRLNTRVPNGARDEFLVAAVAPSFCKAAKLISKPPQSPE